MSVPASVDDYISSQPPEIQLLLGQIRQTIRAAVPEATERIGYGMPGFYLKRPLVWYAAAKHHIGFYPTPSGVTAFPEQSASYQGTKGSLHFPLDQPLPLDLVRKIVLFRVQENLQK